MVRGLDLRTMGLRRVRAALRGLPPEALRDPSIDPKATAWSNEVEMLASLIEVMSAELINVQRALGAKKTNKPIQIERPGTTRRKRSGAMSIADFAKLIGKNNIEYVEGGEPE